MNVLLLRGWGIGLALSMAIAAPPASAETESSLARGGRLYDKWYAVLGTDAPAAPHALYPSDKKYAGDAKSNWRCKECHGWDYLGADGAYQSGSHTSGIKGINGAAGRDPAEIVALLRDPQHGYGDKLAAADLQDLANFVSAGQVDMDAYIDRAGKAPKGDAAQGAAYYNTLCAQCHGLDGKKPKGMKPFAQQMGNPWEVMHKILNGQPDENMPALRALDRQVVADIMSHMATLPE